MNLRQSIRRLAAQLHDEHASGYHDTPHPDCVECVPQNPRERGDDDGVEYGDPRDAKGERS